MPQYLLLSELQLTLAKSGDRIYNISMTEMIISKTIILISVFLVIFADGITTGKIVVFLCCVIALALSLLIRQRAAWYILTLAPAAAVLIIGQERWRICACMAVMMLSALETFHTEKAAELQRQLIMQRDSDAELAMSLQKKNELLMENQDNEVHLATLNERNRIVREIHDNVGHMLSRALLMVGAIRTVNKDSDISESLEKLESTLDTAMTEVRSSVHDLHDEAIDLRENINEAVRSLHNFKTCLDYDCSNDINRDIKLAVIAICKEAVSNIIRHSNGSTVDIILHEQTDFITFSVTDNGTLTEDDMRKINTGIDSGIGLANMRERAEMLGGHVNFITDRGFRVFANIPKKGKTLQ